VPGNPGTPSNSIPANSPHQAYVQQFHRCDVETTDFPYVTYQVQVPVQQIAWQLNLTPSKRFPNLAARLAAVPNEFHNDAYSASVAVRATAYVSAIAAPVGRGPGLSAGTYYATVYGSGTYRCGFTNAVHYYPGFLCF